MKGKIVSIKDLPDWVKKILKSKSIRKDVEVNISTIAKKLGIKSNRNY